MSTREVIRWKRCSEPAAMAVFILKPSLPPDFLPYRRETCGLEDIEVHPQGTMEANEYRNVQIKCQSSSYRISWLSRVRGILSQDQCFSASALRPLPAKNGLPTAHDVTRLSPAPRSSRRGVPSCTSSFPL